MNNRENWRGVTFCLCLRSAGIYVLATTSFPSLHAKKISLPNQIQRLRPGWRPKWGIIRILCKYFYVLLAIRTGHSHPPTAASESHILTPCSYSAHCHNLMNNRTNSGQQHVYNTCALTACAEVLRHLLNTSTRVARKYMHLQHMDIRQACGSYPPKHVFETNRFIFLFSLLVLALELPVSQQWL